MRKKRILITMLEIGNGHKAPAMAIKKTIEELYPKKYDVEVIDLFQTLNYKKLFKIYRNFWTKIFLKHPKISKIIYKLSDNRLTLKSEEILLQKICTLTKEYLKKTKPDLILADHESCIHVFSIIKKQIKIPVIALNTDPFDAHYVWASKNVDNYIVFSKKAKKLLIKKGVDKNKMKLFNLQYPIDPKHSKKIQSKQKLRKKLELKNKQTILMCAGAEGVGNLPKFMKAIIKNNLDFQIIFICGRNENLKKQLEKIKIPKDCKANLKIFSFVTNMQEFLQASDFVLGKPGASQTFETLVKSKPIIFNTYVMNEYPTLKFVTDKKMGWYTPKIKDFINLLKQIQKNPKILNNASRKIEKIKIKSCSKELASYLIEKIKN